MRVSPAPADRLTTGDEPTADRPPDATSATRDESAADTTRLPTARFLVDTSVWLEVLPAGTGDTPLRRRIDELLAADVVATTGMVRLELLGGARTAEEWARPGEMLSALHYVSVEDSHWKAAAELGFHARRSGLTVPFTDLLIGAVAISVDAILVHRDRHFDLLATQSSLKVESHVQAG